MFHIVYILGLISVFCEVDPKTLFFYECLWAFTFMYFLGLTIQNINELLLERLVKQKPQKCCKTYTNRIAKKRFLTPTNCIPKNER